MALPVLRLNGRGHLVYVIAELLPQLVPGKAGGNATVSLLAVEALENGNEPAAEKHHEDNKALGTPPHSPPACDSCL